MCAADREGSRVVGRLVPIAMKGLLIVMRWSLGLFVSCVLALLFGLVGPLWWAMAGALLVLGLAAEGYKTVGKMAIAPACIGLDALLRQAHRRPESEWLGWGAGWDEHKLQQQVDRLGLGQRKAMGFDRRIVHERGNRGHRLIVGAPGTGKTQLFLWLAVQAIGRREAVIVIDPKGGASIPRILQAAAQRVGTNYYELRADCPGKSCRLALCMSYRPSELATHLCRLLPRIERDGVFGQFSWMVLYRVLSGLQLLQQPLSFPLLRSHILQQAKGLAQECRARIGADHDVTQGLRALALHDSVHYSKMILNLLPLLEILATGVLGELLSDAGSQEAVDVERVVKQQGILYVALGAVQDAQVARLLGSLILGELSAWVGSYYQNTTIRQVPIHVMVDEAAEVSGPAFVQLLNKGREAGVQMSLAVQTLADLEVALQGDAEARMMIGNAAHFLAFRTLDPESRRALIDRAGAAQIQMRSSGVSMQDSRRWGRHAQSRGVNVQHPWQELSLLSDGLLSELNDLHYIGHFGGQGLVRGRLVPVSL